MFARNFPVKPTDLGILFCGKILKYKFNLVYFTFNLTNFCLFYFSLYIPLPGCLISLPLPNSGGSLNPSSAFEDREWEWGTIPQGDQGTVPLKLVNLHQAGANTSSHKLGLARTWAMGSSEHTWRPRACGQVPPSPTPLLKTWKRGGQEGYQSLRGSCHRSGLSWRGQRTGWDSWGIFVSSKTPGFFPGSVPTVLSRTVHLSAI